MTLTLSSCSALTFQCASLHHSPLTTNLTHTHPINPISTSTLFLFPNKYHFGYSPQDPLFLKHYITNQHLKNPNLVLHHLPRTKNNKPTPLSQPKNGPRPITSTTPQPNHYHHPHLINHPHNNSRVSRPRPRAARALPPPQQEPAPSGQVVGPGRHAASAGAQDVGGGGGGGGGC
ncbi:hypothetical protein F5144DRAFT_576529 [Chaetomium tenue]|uniref:Uncharacterized protein n=1 Tax=Chaetomium tenue TaxID=1854479 RepID=A0ACB7P1D3_9PEZI|nr:hypothetical protein F5144DRAFT_576529 [Chaetomium globosum]